jgi:hypothetical protein
VVLQVAAAQDLELAAVAFLQQANLQGAFDDVELEVVYIGWLGRVFIRVVSSESLVRGRHEPMEVATVAVLVVFTA